MPIYNYSKATVIFTSARHKKYPLVEMPDVNHLNVSCKPFKCLM